METQNELEKYNKKEEKKEEKKNKRIAITKKTLFFPFRIIPKKIRTAIHTHYTETKKFTFLAEVCGILGLLVSIAIFYYTNEINRTQKEIESSNRNIEFNQLVTAEKLASLILTKNMEEYKQSPHKVLLDSIIDAEFFFNYYILQSDIYNQSSEFMKSVDSTKKEIDVERIEFIFNSITTFEHKLLFIYEYIENNLTKGLNNSDVVYLQKNLYYIREVKPKQDKFLDLLKKIDKETAKDVGQLKARKVLRIMRDNEFKNKFIDHIKPFISLMEYNYDYILLKKK